MCPIAIRRPRASRPATVTVDDVDNDVVEVIDLTTEAPDNPAPRPRRRRNPAPTPSPAAPRRVPLA